MHSSVIIAMIEERARMAKDALTVRIGLLATQAQGLREATCAQIFGDGARTLERATDFLMQSEPELARAEASGEEIRRIEDEAAEAKALLRAGGLRNDELAVALESLCQADDFLGIARNILEQFCVLVRDEEGGAPRVLEIAFAVSDETLAVERAARGRGVALAA